MAIRWTDPLWGDMGVDDVFGRPFAPPPDPPANLREEEDALRLELELPGLTLDDLEITMLGRQLTIRGERKDPGDPPEAYQRRERPAGAFARTLELPYDIERDGVQAVFEDGVLEITLPKAAEARPKRIPVRGGGASREIEPVTVKRKEG